MKIRVLLAAAGLTCMAAGGVLAEFPSEFRAVTPGQINYQGRLKTPAGDSYTNGVYNMEFRLWDSSSGGDLIWGARYTIYAREGYFNVVLGAPGGVTVTNSPYQAEELWKALWYDPALPINDIFLGITVYNDPAGNPIPEEDAEEAFPRQRLLSSPFAERAQMAQYAREAVSDFRVPGNLTVGGNIDADGQIDVAADTFFSGNSTISGRLTLNNGVIVNGSVADLNSGLDVSGAKTYLRNGLEVTGAAELKGGALVTGNSTFYNDLTIGDDLFVTDDAWIDRLVLSGFGFNGDVAIDFGSYYAIYADNVGSISETTSRLWLAAPNGGEITLGPRSGRLNFLYGKSNYTRFDGARANFTSISSFEIESTRPFHLYKYYFANNESVYHNTGVSTADWTAMVVGFDAGYNDVDEGGAENSWAVYMYQSGGTWWLRCEGHTHNNHPDWTVHVLYIRSELTQDYR